MQMETKNNAKKKKIGSSIVVCMQTQKKRKNILHSMTNCIFSINKGRMANTSTHVLIYARKDRENEIKILEVIKLVQEFKTPTFYIVCFVTYKTGIESIH